MYTERTSKAKFAREAEGFLYIVSSLGVTFADVSSILMVSEVRKKERREI